MNRKNFLSSIAGLGGIIPSLSSEDGKDTVAPQKIIPPYLKRGDLIGITSPAGFIKVENIQPAVQQMSGWGFRIKMGSTIGKKNFGFAGTDRERLTDLQSMLDDPEIKAVMCARGGYGLIRIIDRIDFRKFQKNPKWVIGFSDVTALHAHLNKNFGIASIHSKMCNSFPDDWLLADQQQKDTILSIRQALTGPPLKYSFSASVFNKPGRTEGILIGGNLKTIESLAGTNSDLYTNGKILFLEDTGEYLYSIDRMFWNLKRTGKLVGLKGLIIGGFKIKPDDPGEEFGIPLQEIVLEKMKHYNYPVCFDFPVGHQKNNYALKCGASYKLNVQSPLCILEEIT